MFTSAIKTIGSRSGIGRRIEAQTERVVYGSQYLRGEITATGHVVWASPEAVPFFETSQKNLFRHSNSAIEPPLPAQARTRSLGR